MSEPRKKASFSLTIHNIYETLAVCFPTLVEAAQGKVTKEVCDERLSRWCARVVENAGIRLEVSGREHLARHRTFLIMSNHQSHYDVPAIFHAIGANIRMIAKKELFRIPLFGAALEAGGFVSIDRGDRESAIESLEAAKSLLASGTHVWIAPEGTRSTGELLPFKKGGFHLALDTGLPILPVTVQGTRNVLPVSAVRSTAGARVRVAIHAPIDSASYTREGRAGRDRLMADVRRAIAAGLSS